MTAFDNAQVRLGDLPGVALSKPERHHPVLGRMLRKHGAAGRLP